ncbi:hypothetical protein [Desulfovibrio sp. TomC]|uniref:hypothetical protein n=1 Tax=Desulfovibrio sp. TomC TaxID=1562888 RepID=UPI0012E26850|nr:hypothetical protein [Desulfovibrio sp. TomC]
MLPSNNKQMEMDHEAVYSFSELLSHQFIANHADKAMSAVLIFSLAYITLIQNIMNIKIVLLYMLFSIIICLFRVIQNKFCNRIVLRFNERKALFYMNRNSGIVDNNFSDIKSIRVNGYIVVVTNKQRIYFANTHNIQLCQCLNRISEIKWGLLCNIFGPPPEFRDKVATTATGD